MQLTAESSAVCAMISFERIVRYYVDRIIVEISCGNLLSLWGHSREFNALIEPKPSSRAAVSKY